MSRSIRNEQDDEQVSPEVRERAVRMVSEHRADYRSEWDAMVSIAGKIGCMAERPASRCVTRSSTS